MAHAAAKDPSSGASSCAISRAFVPSERVAGMAEFGKPAGGGRGRGIALVEASIPVGEVAHVAVAPDGTLRVRNVFAICGLRGCR
jgi:hypothetical protein